MKRHKCHYCGKVRNENKMVIMTANIDGHIYKVKSRFQNYCWLCKDQIDKPDDIHRHNLYFDFCLEY